MMRSVERAMMASERIHDLAKHVVSHVGDHGSKVEAFNSDVRAMAGTAIDHCHRHAAAGDRADDLRQHRTAAAPHADRKADRGPGRRVAELWQRSPHRLADRAGQSPRVRRRDSAAIRRVAASPHAVHLDDARRRQFQRNQRFVRPPDRRRGAATKSAKCITANSRQMDFRCRYGGDEFVVILPDTGTQETRTAADRIRSAIEKHRGPRRRQDRCR